MKEKMNLGKAFDIIAEKTLESKLNKKTIEELSGTFRYLKRRLGLDVWQCYIVAVLLDRTGEIVTLRELAMYAGVTRTLILSFFPQIKDLQERGFIKIVAGYEVNDWKQSYMASESLIQAVRLNSELSPINYRLLDTDDFWDRISAFLKDCDYGKIGYQYMLHEIKSLIDHTQHLDFCQKLMKLDLDDENLILFLVACNGLVSKEEDFISHADFKDIFPMDVGNRLFHQLINRTSALFAKGIMEHSEAEIQFFQLTEETRLNLLGASYAKSDPTESQTEHRVGKESVPVKAMFYNKNEAVQIERLKNLLQEENFSQICSRMNSVGMKAGFTILFHGAPGTGKTETVLQLAQQTGRELVQINLASLKSMWVGESEKNIENVFTDYEEKLSESELAPILFFNEADGIFGKRFTGINTEVDQMSNAIQNIILQNMETFEGILIATTNLTDNFDSAFERRFLYKIEFMKPTADVRKKIWQSLVPEMNGNLASLLAERFDFSGAQIENIARKMMIDSILYGHEPTPEEIVAICNEEKVSKKLRLNKISA